MKLGTNQEQRPAGAEVSLIGNNQSEDLVSESCVLLGVDTCELFYTDWGFGGSEGWRLNREINMNVQIDIL